MKILYLLLLILFTQNIAHAQDQLTLMLDWFVNPDHGPIIVAEQKGLFDDQDIQLNIQEPTDPSLPAKLVAAGNVDLAVSYQPHLIVDVSENLPLTWVSTLIATPLNTITVLADSPYKSLSDLKGKKIGYAIGGGLEQVTIGTMLENAGISTSDVELINVGWTLSSSLASGKVEAIYGGFRNFELNQLAIEGFEGRAFFVEEEGVPPYDELVIVAKKGALSTDMTQRLNRALELATQYIVNHPEDAWELFKAYSPEKLDTELNRRAWFDTLSRFALRPAALDIARYENYADFLVTKGIIGEKPLASAYLTP